VLALRNKLHPGYGSNGRANQNAGSAIYSEFRSN
jgi:hypothetical protein